MPTSLRNAFNAFLYSLVTSFALYFAVVVVPFAGLDIFGILNSVSKREFIQMTVKQMETYLYLSRQQAKEHGESALGIVSIIDVANFNLRQWAWRPGKRICRPLPLFLDHSVRSAIRVIPARIFVRMLVVLFFCN